MTKQKKEAVDSDRLREELLEVGEGERSKEAAAEISEDDGIEFLESDAAAESEVVIAEKEEKKWVTPPPNHKIAGSNLEPLGWYTNYTDPSRFSDIADIRALFAEIAMQDNVSDIIIKSGAPVAIKIKRFGLKAVTRRVLYHEEVLILCQTIASDPAISSRISKGKPISGLAQVLDTSNYNPESGIQSGKSRYRYEITACSSRDEENGISVIMRPLPDMPLTHEQLGIPIEFVNKCIVKDGIVIVAGATGEGKSTTIASVIRYILENDTTIKGNIITHEDPIEVSFDLIKSPHSETMQSSIGQGDHVLSYNNANRSAMRRSPDLVLLGELRDEDTIEAAVELSLTGHPVFATTHASSISAIFPRLISRFPKDVQGQKGFDLIDVTRFLVAQKLIWTTKGKRLAVREELQITEGLRLELIKYAEKPDVLYKIINNIMKNESFGAVSYASQAKRMLADGIIDDRNYFYLVGDFNQLTLEEIATIEGYSHG